MNKERDKTTPAAQSTPPAPAAPSCGEVSTEAMRKANLAAWADHLNQDTHSFMDNLLVKYGVRPAYSTDGWLFGVRLPLADAENIGQAAYYRCLRERKKTEELLIA